MVQRFFKILYYACRGRHLTEKAVIVLAKFGFVVYILYGVVTWLYPGRAAERLERRRAVAAAALSLGLTVVAAALLRKIWRRPRPFMSGKTALLRHGNSPSFPSNHTIHAAAIGAAVMAYRQKEGTSLLLWGLAQGAARVYCGVHYASDIIGSVVLGAACALAVCRSKVLAGAAERLALFVTTVEEALKRY